MGCWGIKPGWAIYEADPLRAVLFLQPSEETFLEGNKVVKLGQEGSTPCPLLRSGEEHRGQGGWHVPCTMDIWFQALLKAEAPLLGSLWMLSLPK